MTLADRWPRSPQAASRLRSASARRLRSPGVARLAADRQLVAERYQVCEALLVQAWELRGSPYLRDAVQALIDEWERWPLRMLELRQERQARLLRLLRETDPASLGRKRAA